MADTTADITTDIEPNNELSDAQNRAVVALISTATVQEAAEKSGVSRATLYRWAKDLDFRREYHEARRNSFSAAVGRSQRMTDQSLQCLRGIILGPGRSLALRRAKITAALYAIPFRLDSLRGVLRCLLRPL